MDMLNIGPKGRQELDSLSNLTPEERKARRDAIPEAAADDPFYKRGFSIGETRSSGSLKSTAGKASPQSNNSSPNSEESSTKQGWTEEEFKRGEEALANLMKQNPPRILSE